MNICVKCLYPLTSSPAVALQCFHFISERRLVNQQDHRFPIHHSPPSISQKFISLPWIFLVGRKHLIKTTVLRICAEFPHSLSFTFARVDGFCCLSTTAKLLSLKLVLSFHLYSSSTSLLLEQRKRNTSIHNLTLFHLFSLIESTWNYYWH